MPKPKPDLEADAAKLAHALRTAAAHAKDEAAEKSRRDPVWAWGHLMGRAALVIEEQCIRLEAARSVVVRGEWDDDDLADQCKRAAKVVDSGLLEMAAIRLRQSAKEAVQRAVGLTPASADLRRDQAERARG